jgi:hypothetical protein
MDGAHGEPSTDCARRPISTPSDNSPQANGQQVGGNGFYVPKYIKRSRRTKVGMVSIREAIHKLLSEDNPQTVRQVLYQLTVLGVIEKAEIEYHRTVVRLLGEMREAGEIPFEWLADNTRWMRKPTTFTNLAESLEIFHQGYRRNLWAAMPAYVEVWCEKDALAGEVYDVPLMVSRGYSSLSFVHGAAQVIKSKGKPAYIYHFGDLDPSGVDAARDIKAKLRRYAPEAEIHFERVAVTREQVEEWDLPTRPTKTKDTRAAKFVGTSVELDAIPGKQLRALVHDRIDWHVDKDQLKVIKVAEQFEREALAGFTKVWRGGAA